MLCAYDRPRAKNSASNSASEHVIGAARYSTKARNKHAAGICNARVSE
jgi:hypothetical protein